MLSESASASPTVAFAARLAARAADPDGAHVVEPEGTPAFLAPWPVRALIPADVEPDGDVVALADLLGRLGVRTLGAFAALPAPAVLARFGTSGARAAPTRLRESMSTTTPPVPPPPDLVESAELDPPATRVDEAAFAAKTLADRLLGRLDELGLSCTQVVVEAETEHGERLARCWRHEGALTPAALVDRVRWQLEGWLTAADAIEDDGFTTGGLTLLRLVPDEVVPADGRQLGFWGGDAAARDRADRVLARLQGLLGHDAVVTAVPCGGRTPAERVRWVPWGEPRDDDPTGPRRRTSGRARSPGRRPPGVHDPPVAAELLDAEGSAVGVSGRGEAIGVARRAACAPRSRTAAARFGPGPARGSTTCAGGTAHPPPACALAGRRRRRADTAIACLVGLERGRATVEAIYD